MLPTDQTQLKTANRNITLQAKFTKYYAYHLCKKKTTNDLNDLWILLLLKLFIIEIQEKINS